jgi:hypothetical protein
MGMNSRVFKFFTVILVALLGLHGIAEAGVNEETVASVNGDKIRGLELRESLGLWGGAISASGIPMEKKKDALNRLIDGRLLEQSARSRNLDKTEDFSKRVKELEGGLWIPVLFRIEVAARVRIDSKEVRAESTRLQKADKSLSRENALTRAKVSILDREMRKTEQEVISAARKDASVRIIEDAIQRIGKGERLEDNTVLGAMGALTLSYGEAISLLKPSQGSGHGSKELSVNPEAVRSVVDRELTGRALLAYARNRKVEDTEWMSAARRELERAILIDHLTEKEILKGIKVSEKEIGETYAKHSKMLVRDGKTIPLSEVKEEIRRTVQGEKRNKAMKEYLEKRKKKAKIKIDEKLLQRI